MSGSAMARRVAPRHLVSHEGGRSSALIVHPPLAVYDHTREDQLPVVAHHLNEWEWSHVAIALEDRGELFMRDIAVKLRAQFDARKQHPVYGDDAPPHGMTRPRT